MKFKIYAFFLCAMILLSSCTHREPVKSNEVINVVHFNIFELDSLKITSLPGQLRAVKEVLSPLSFDLLSINEIQYDLPGVPNKDYKTRGENMARLMKFLSPEEQWNISFFPANTGRNAQRKSNGSYPMPRDKGARKLADPINYGLFPAQYSSGLASRYPIIKRVVIDKLKWAEFNPKLNLERYRAGNKSKLPRTMELFDKNFVDTVVQIGEKKVHIITLHTVPAYHFGNKLTPNYQRNADQLAFLEWYLDSKVSHQDQERTQRLEKLGIVPLAKGDHFIALGDWNTDVYAANPGSSILRRLFKSMGVKARMQVTHESAGIKLRPFMMQLDYILHSTSFKTLEQSVLRSPPSFLKKGCHQKVDQLRPGHKQTVVELKRSKSKKICFGVIDHDYATQKKASDHFALFQKLVFKEQP